MYDPCFSPAYQIPYQPLYDTTRQEIERSIFTLEDKLRRRKQIDREFAVRPTSLQALDFQHNYNQTMRNYQCQNQYYSKLEQEQLIRDQITMQTCHLNRLQQLRLQRDHLCNQMKYVKTPEIYNAQGFGANYANDDQLLLRQYEDGSKAKEYYQDIKNQSNKQKDHKEDQINDIERKIKNQQIQRQRFSSQTYTKPKNNDVFYRTDNKQIAQTNLKKEEYATPYNIIKDYNQKLKSNQETFKGIEFAHQLEKEFDKVQQKKMRSKSVAKIGRNVHSPLKIREQGQKEASKQVSPYKRLNNYQSLGKFTSYRGKSGISPHKRSLIDDSYLQSRMIPKIQPKLSIKQIQLSALQKINNRLKVSKIIYEDSQFRNIKYEVNHLYNTFEIELKQRKQVKDKINGNSLVLRKHSLVVD